MKKSALFHVKKRGKKGMYYVYYYENGVQKADRISTDYGAVQPYLRKLAQRLNNQRLGLTIKNYSFEQFCIDYIENVSKAHKAEKTIIRDTLTIESFKRKFQNIKYVEQFTADVVNRYKSLRREDKIKNNTKNIEKATINRELSTLRSMLKYAYQKKLLDQQEHVNVIKFEEDYKFEGRALTNEEVNNYLEYFEHPYKTALQIIAYSALRPGEAVKLCYSWIDFENDMIFPNGTKTMQSSNSIPLHQKLKEILLIAKKSAKNDIICCFDNGKRLSAEVLSSWRYKIVKKHNLRHFRPYDLRHTAATKMIESGESLTKVSKILRHSSTAMTEQVYVHIRRQTLKDTVNAINYKN
ncbi:MAG: site-specific integrase [Endomicrobium sp.]|nr:site-specific integrase [Endomicrobium sp.]